MTSDPHSENVRLSAARRSRRPVVYIPVFPGTNCDYDTAKAFRAAGAEVRTSVLCNIAGDDVLRSIAEMKEHIRRAHIFVLRRRFLGGRRTRRKRQIHCQCVEQ